jgi:hypothetical protein
LIIVTFGVPGWGISVSMILKPGPDWTKEAGAREKERTSEYGTRGDPYREQGRLNPVSVFIEPLQ